MVTVPRDSRRKRTHPGTPWSLLCAFRGRDALGVPPEDGMHFLTARAAVSRQKVSFVPSWTKRGRLVPRVAPKFGLEKLGSKFTKR